MIKHFYLKKWTTAQIKAKLEEVHGDSAPAFKTIYFWIKKFKRGRTCTEDPARSGRPVEVATKEVIEKVHGIVMGDLRIKIREIAEIVGISTERVHNILHEQLHMKKLCARRMARFHRNPQDFLRRFVTVDETWIHHYTPE